jgi:hypothetical protein
VNNSQASALYVGSDAVREVRKGSQLVLAPNGDALWYKANERPSLDLRFAEDKSLVDATTGSNLVDFTRASSGTYVGSDGLIKTATTNLLVRSEEFNDASWTKTRCSITANAALSPDGTLTADKLVEDTTATSSHRITGISIPLVSLPSASIYLKAAERTEVVFAIIRDFGTGSAATETVMDLQAGTVISGPGIMTAVGNGWYRVSAQATVSGANYAIRVNLLDPSGSGSYTGDGASGIYIWGAQLEQSSTVGEYVKTTSTINSAPRFDHNPTTGESLGLLVEESRTNLITTSEALVNITNATISNNTTTAPDGLTTANTLIENTSTGAHSVNTASITWAGNTTYTFTIFLKANTRSQVNLAFGTSSSWVNGQRSAVFDLSSGTVASSAASPVVASIDSFPSGWYRCRLTATTVASPAPSTTQIQMYVSGSSSYAGDGTSGLLFWGAQLEAGSFPTSYIPTTTATVTRAADVASISGSNFSSWYRQEEGTLFFHSQNYSTLSDTTLYCIDDGTTGQANQIDARIVSGVDYRARVRSSGSSSSDIDPGPSFAIGEAVKLSHAFKVNNFAASQNGLAAVVDTSGAMPAVDGTNLELNKRGSGDVQGRILIRRLTYWPARLPNETLQTITQ